MQLNSYTLTLSQQWKSFLLPALLVYMLLVYVLRDRRAKSLERRFSPAGRASFCRMTTNDAQAILKDLTELEFPKFFGFSIIFALFKARSPDAIVKQSPQIRATSAYCQAIDIRNTKRFLSSRCYWAAHRCRDGIQTNCRHWGLAARVRTQRANI